MVSKNFGKLTSTKETVTDEVTGISYSVYMLRDNNGKDWLEVARDNPFAFYLAVLDDGCVISMTDDASQSQIVGCDIIGIDSDFGFTFGSGGTVYGAIWDGSSIVPSAEVLYPDLSSFDFRDKLRNYQSNSYPNGISRRTVDQAIAAVTDLDEQDLLLDFWELKPTYTRVDPSVDLLLSKLTPPLSAEEIDEIWVS